MVKVRVAEAPEASSNVPSPSRSQACAASGPSASSDVETSLTCCPVIGSAGVTVKLARGGALTLTCRTSSTLTPLLSRTRWRTVFGPGLPYVCRTAAPVASKVPSLLKSHSTDAIEYPGTGVDAEMNLAD